MYVYIYLLQSRYCNNVRFSKIIKNTFFYVYTYIYISIYLYYISISISDSLLSLSLSLSLYIYIYIYIYTHILSQSLSVSIYLSEHIYICILWFNTPYYLCVKTNVGKIFLLLIKKHFPKENSLSVRYSIRALYRSPTVS